MDKVRLWVHLGMPKTGTSALQSFLNHNSDVLLNNGVLYPDMGVMQHFPLVRSLAKEVGSPAVFPKGGQERSVYEFSNTIKEDVSRSGASAVVLSSEFFFDYPGLTPKRGDYPIEQALPHIKNVAQRLKEAFSEFDPAIVVWLRRQDDWLMSMYNNVVKAHSYEKSFERFRREQVAPWYGSILSQWGDIFGDEAITVLVYQKGGADYDTVTRFIKLIGFAAIDDLVKPPSNVREGNIGLPRELMYMKREFNRALVLPAPRARSEIEDYFFNLAHNKRYWERDFPILSPAKRQQLLNDFAYENELVVTRFMAGMAGELFDAELPSQEEWEPFVGYDSITMNEVYVGLLAPLIKRINYLEKMLSKVPQ